MTLLPFVAAWLLLAVALFVAADPTQKYLYDNVTPGMWWRAPAACLPLAALLVYSPVRLDEMFTSSLHWTLLHCVLWFLACWLVFGFSPIHAGFVGPVGFLLFGWAASLVVDNLSKKPLPIGLTGS